MVSRKVLFVLLAAAFAAALPQGTSWAGAPKPCQGGMLKVAQSAYPPTLDWLASTSVATREIDMNIFESLVSYNKKFEVIPMLATQWRIAPDEMS